jgi:hypothetical protein
VLVLGIVERGGLIIVKPVINTKRETIQPIMRKAVKLGSVIFTDEWLGYKGLSRLYEHRYVNHALGEYVDGNEYTNTIEGFRSLFKRGVNGIYHNISLKHLERYSDEFTYPYTQKTITKRKDLMMLLPKVREIV